MDLAKIRKKYQAPVSGTAINAAQDTDMVTPALPISQPALQMSITPLVDFIDSTVPETALGMPAAERVIRDKAGYRDPVEIILAGRSAAGCGEAEPDDQEDHTPVATECLEFLCFRVSDEIYGINIMDIKEIIKPREVTEVPCAPPFVAGIISLRGTIIPIIDMRSRLALHAEDATGKERVIVIKNNQSLSGLLVDEVIQVVHIDAQNIEPAPSVLDGLNRDFVTGVGRSEGRFVIILNLDSIADIHLY